MGPTNPLPVVDIRTRQEWRAWLDANHASSRGIWLVFHKDHTGVPCVPYEDAVCEALCFGWIDSLIKRLDDRRFARKFTPRTPDAQWSDLNRRRWSEMQRLGRLAAPGLKLGPAG